jgi:hypothetical protein
MIALLSLPRRGAEVKVRLKTALPAGKYEVLADHA